MNELSIIVMMTLAAILWAAITYSVGYKEGERVGFTRGRSVSRHISQQPAIIALPSDIKFSDDQLKAVSRHISSLNKAVK